MYRIWRNLQQSGFPLVLKLDPGAEKVLNFDSVIWVGTLNSYCFEVQHWLAVKKCDNRLIFDKMSDIQKFIFYGSPNMYFQAVVRSMSIARWNRTRCMHTSQMRNGIFLQWNKTNYKSLILTLILWLPTFGRVTVATIECTHGANIPPHTECKR